MKKQEFMKTVKAGFDLLGKNSPAILTGVGIAGMVTAGVLAVKATPKAMRIIEAEKRLHGEDEEVILSKTDIVKAAWKPYVPAVGLAVVSAGCLIGSCSVSTRRSAAIATAYKLSETACGEFKKKAVEVVGEKKVAEIKDAVNKERIKENPVSNSEVIVTGKGKTLCYDNWSGRYFYSDADTIKRAEIALNRQLISDMYVSLSEFYDYLGLRPTKGSEELGWNIDAGEIRIELGALLSDDETPCLMIDYNIAPRYDYSKLA